MRIIAGSLGGRTFDSPHSNRTHPMSDKMRGALFNILGDIGGLSVLDAFGGSGALSFEAISRGAARATITEQDRPAQKVIAQNITALGLTAQVQLIAAGAGAWLDTTTNEFALVLCDPPYHDLQPQLLQRLASRVAAGGLLVLSYPAHKEAPPFAGFTLLKQQTYGDAQLIFYRADEQRSA